MAITSAEAIIRHIAPHHMATGGRWCPKNPDQARFSLWSATAVLPRPGAWPTVLPMSLRRPISSQSNNAGCPWPTAMRSNRDPSANSVAETGGGQTSRGPRPRLRPTDLFKSFPFSRTSSAVRRKNPAISANDIPRSSESFKKNRSALAHGLPMSAGLGSMPDVSFMTTPGITILCRKQVERTEAKEPRDTPITLCATPHNLPCNPSQDAASYACGEIHSRSPAAAGPLKENRIERCSMAANFLSLDKKYPAAGGWP
jgi:hypothetical protein